jgi:hypothetical protein
MEQGSTWTMEKGAADVHPGERMVPGGRGTVLAFLERRQRRSAAGMGKERSGRFPCRHPQME